MAEANAAQRNPGYNTVSAVVGGTYYIANVTAKLLELRVDHSVEWLASTEGAPKAKITAFPLLKNKRVAKQAAEILANPYEV